jgi:hypothetical protein
LNRQSWQERRRCRARYRCVPAYLLPSSPTLRGNIDQTCWQARAALNCRLATCRLLYLRLSLLLFSWAGGRLRGCGAAGGGS